MSRVRVLLAILLLGLPATAYVQPAELLGPAPPAAVHQPGPFSLDFQLTPLREAAASLLVAAALASMLAFRPRRRGSPEPSPVVAQTQIILGIVGALVMIVVGASLARAFAIVGAASLVRYRAKVSDPKDAGVMLCTLSLGLAAGVGLYLVASFATLFLLAALWVLESREPEVKKRFGLTIKAKDAAALRAKIEELLRKNRIGYELRTTTPDELSFEVKLPQRKKTDQLSNQILGLHKDTALEVEWDEKKEKTA
jgi:hypothetical protein